MSILNTILSSNYIAPGIKKIQVFQPDIARKSKPGQFVIVHLDDTSERIPLTIVDGNKDHTTITLVVQEVGKSTRQLNQMNAGDIIQDVAGPLGMPSEVNKVGTVVIIGGGVGTAVAYPVAKAFKDAGNKVLGIIGGRTKEHVILEQELQKVCDEVFISTDDGSRGFHGNTAQLLQKIIEDKGNINFVFASGPLLMMKAIADLTRKMNIPTRVSLNSLMVDGTGMCGGCRVIVGGKVLFTCVDGPEFDGHQVDFDTLIKRNNSYRDVEQTALNLANSPTAVTKKKRVDIARHKMPAQDADVRIKNFNEVNLGYPEAIALAEASRCLFCPRPTCVAGCPVNVQIPQFIKKIVEGEYLEAASIYKNDNTLALVCARVCPQSEQCEGNCVLAKKGEAVAIGNLARFVLDIDRQMDKEDFNFDSPDKHHRIAIVGSGPAGLACAGDLVRMGYEVTVFEALHEFGGVLMYGIPEFRLPKSIVGEEIGALQKKGVVFKKNFLIGATLTIDDLFASGFEAVFIGTGAGLPNFMNIPGEEMIGVYSANEFLIRVNLMRAYDFPAYDTPILNCRDKRVAVIGGGNTALDSARAALRLGARKVQVIYRRTEVDMPARKEEYEHAREEGIQFQFLCVPKQFIGNTDDRLTGAILQRMKQGEVDASGRRSPVPIEGSDYKIDLDLAIIAVGNGSNPIIQKTTPDLEFNKRGNIVVNPDTMATNRLGVFGGGDIVTGGATVILAMGAGRKAATAIDNYLKKR